MSMKKKVIRNHVDNVYKTLDVFKTYGTLPKSVFESFDDESRVLSLEGTHAPGKTPNGNYVKRSGKGNERTSGL